MLFEKLDNLIMESMKAHMEVRTRTLRAIKAAFLEAKTAKNAEELTEAKEIQVMQKMVKQREDSRQQYIDAGRIELGKNEFAEMQIIQEFLPKPVTAEAIENAYLRTIDGGLEPIKANMGTIIKEIKNRLPGADGKLVAQIVSQHLK